MSHSGEFRGGFVGSIVKVGNRALYIALAVSNHDVSFPLRECVICIDKPHVRGSTS